MHGLEVGLVGESIAQPSMHCEVSLNTICTRKELIQICVEGLSESLNAEIEPLGLRSILLEPGYFRTEFLTPDHRAPYKALIADYQEAVGRSDDALRAYNGKQPGDPKRFVKLLMDIVRGEGAVKERSVPTNLPVGSDGYKVVREICERNIRNR